MEDSEIMTEIPEENSAETTSIQEVTEILTTELLTSEETTETTTECLIYQNIDKINIDRLNDFTYLGIFFMIFIILITIFRGLYGLFRIFF